MFSLFCITIVPFPDLCEALSNPDNGVILYETNGVNTVAAIECEAGHSLKGAYFMMCFSDGRWNDTLPSCGRFCIDL